jgi:hypothetical protein
VGESVAVSPALTKKMKCKNLNEQPSFGLLSASFAFAVLPIYLASLPLYLAMAIFFRFLSALRLSTRSKATMQTVSTQGRDVPKKKVPQNEWNDLTDTQGSEAWDVLLEDPMTLALMREHLEICLDYSISPCDDILY